MVVAGDQDEGSGNERVAVASFVDCLHGNDPGWFCSLCEAEWVLVTVFGVLV